jgi:hypothetical protein
MIFMNLDYSNFDFVIMFMNSDKNFKNLKTGEEKWKVRLMVEEFKKRIGEMEG